MTPQEKIKILQRFWKFIDVCCGYPCWIWKGSRDQAGYGHFQINGKICKAHRFSYEQKYGEIPPGLYICHHCDNPSCVNPRHLFVDTQNGNIKDKVKKDRQTKGEKAPTAKLCESDVIKIREEYTAFDKEHSTIALGQKYGVSSSRIWYIVNNKSWTHL